MGEGSFRPPPHDVSTRCSLAARICQHNETADKRLTQVIASLSDHEADGVSILPPKLLSDDILVGGTRLFQLTIRQGERTLTLTSVDVAKLAGWVDQGRPWRIDPAFLGVRGKADRILEVIRDNPDTAAFQPIDAKAYLSNPQSK